MLNWCAIWQVKKKTTVNHENLLYDFEKTLH